MMKLLLFAAALVALAIPALADTVIAPEPSTTTVAIGNALTIVLTACVPPVAAILAGALWKLWTKWGFQATALDKANLESDLQTALAFGVSKTIPAIHANGWDQVDVHSQIIAEAARYFLERFPDRSATIAAAAVATPAGEGTTPKEAVADTLTARLPEAVTAAAVSPATPPAPQPAPQIVLLPTAPAVPASS